METKLKEFRAKFNLSQEQLAKNMNVSRQTINAIEKGRYNPSLKLAFELADFFKVKVEELFSHKEKEIPEHIEVEFVPQRHGYL